MTQTPGDSEALWEEYYRMISERPPRDILYRVLHRFTETGAAIDLGSGTGTESLLMLKQGWKVLAVDQQEKALQTLRQNVPQDQKSRLRTSVASFESVELPSADLIWAGYSLPFCHPKTFESVWAKIVSALGVGGRFAGDFFGPRHDWSDNEEMTYHARSQVEALVQGLHLEYFVEEEGEMQTALDGIRHWHMFTISVRKQ